MMLLRSHWQGMTPCKIIASIPQESAIHLTAFLPCTLLKSRCSYAHFFSWALLKWLDVPYANADVLPVVTAAGFKSRVQIRWLPPPSQPQISVPSVHNSMSCVLLKCLVRFFEVEMLGWDHSSAVEHMVCMQSVPASILRSCCQSELPVLGEMDRKSDLV